MLDFQWNRKIFFCNFFRYTVCQWHFLHIGEEICECFPYTPQQSATIQPVHNGNGGERQSTIPRHTDQVRRGRDDWLQCVREAHTYGPLLAVLVHHPCHVKGGMVSGLFHRARAITQGVNREKEEGHLTQVLQENWYPYEVVRTASQSRLQRKQKEPLHTLCIPYILGLSEDLRRVCRKYSVRTVFKTPSTLRRELSRIKDRDPALKASGEVCKIPCSCGQKYMGKQRDHWRCIWRSTRQPQEKERQRNQQLQNTPGLDTTSLSGRRHESLTVQATPPPCWSRKPYTSPSGTQQNC